MACLLILTGILVLDSLIYTVGLDIYTVGSIS